MIMKPLPQLLEARSVGYTYTLCSRAKGDALVYKCLNDKTAAILTRNPALLGQC